MDTRPAHYNEHKETGKKIVESNTARLPNRSKIKGMKLNQLLTHALESIHQHMPSQYIHHTLKQGKVSLLHTKLLSTLDEQLMPAGETSERAENSRFAAVYTAERPVIEMFTEEQLYK